MKRVTRAALILASTLAALALGAGAFVGSGVYDIGADDHHTRIVLALIEQLRDRSIGVRARAIEVPELDDAARIAAGARQYAALCVSCHLAPGVTKSDLRPGLYPHPPNLAQQNAPDARRAFWTIKHGVKMSAMPAWGKTLDDAVIWDMVAFVRKLPQMSPEAYQQLSQ
jgi:mono/diheme cytochrome c family protein